MKVGVTSWKVGIWILFMAKVTLVGRKRRMGKKRRSRVQLTSRLFSYLYLRAALPTYNANNKQYPIKMFLFCFPSLENDSDMEGDDR